MSALRVLPLSVRFASEHKGCQLGREEILDLLNGGFVDEAVPLVLEALASDPDAQEKFLDEITHCAWQYSSDVALYTIIHEALDALSLECRVPARELIEMSWCGFVERQKVETCAAVNWAEVRVPVLVGYSSAIALVPLIRHGTPFYLMLPDGDGGMNGYEFYPTPDGPKVFVMVDTNISEGKKSLIYLPDKTNHRLVKVLKADFESRRPCDIILESVFG